MESTFSIFTARTTRTSSSIVLRPQPPAGRAAGQPLLADGSLRQPRVRLLNARPLRRGRVHRSPGGQPLPAPWTSPAALLYGSRPRRSYPAVFWVALASGPCWWPSCAGLSCSFSPASAAGYSTAPLISESCRDPAWRDRGEPLAKQRTTTHARFLTGSLRPPLRPDGRDVHDLPRVGCTLVALYCHAHGRRAHLSLPLTVRQVKSMRKLQ